MALAREKEASLKNIAQRLQGGDWQTYKGVGEILSSAVYLKPDNLDEAVMTIIFNLLSREAQSTLIIQMRAEQRKVPPH